MEIVEPSARFMAVRFPAPTSRWRPEDPPVGSVPDYTAYECPGCGWRVSFELRHFQAAAVKPKSNLSAQDAREATAIHGGEPKREESYLDWYCPGCGKAVRAYYSCWIAEMGGFSVEITQVVEST